jgi:hypothetical protein
VTVEEQSTYHGSNKVELEDVGLPKMPMRELLYNASIVELVKTMWLERY